VTEDPAGGRVLIVAPSESGAAPDGDGGPFTRGGNASRVDPAEDTAAVGGDSGASGDDGGTAGTSPEAGSGAHNTDDPTAEGPNVPSGESSGSGGDTRECDPEAVADGIADRLAVDVVLRDEQTAGEYLKELGPTIDCVVVLGDDTGPLGSLNADVSVPAVVCEHPVVETGLDPDAGAIPVSAVAARVQTIVREARNRSDLRDQNTRLTALSRYAGDITGCETVDDVLDRTVEAATEALAFDHCVILLADGDRLMPRASALPEPDLKPSGATEGIAGRTLEAGEAEIVPDMQSDADAITEHDDLRALLSVPIGSRGVLQIASRSSNAFDEHDKEFAEILSGYTREALARLEREVTLRAERDRLHAFYTAVPVPVLCIERRGGQTTVTDVNGAYEGAFGGNPTGQPLSAALPTEAEHDRYAAALNDGGTTRATVVRQVGGRDEDVVLTVIPISPPGESDYAFGVYLTEQAGADKDG